MEPRLKADIKWHLHTTLLPSFHFRCAREYEVNKWARKIRPTRRNVRSDQNPSGRAECDCILERGVK